MALTPRIVTEIMRQRLGLASAAKAAAVTLQIPQALKETGRRMAADPTTRALLQTDRTVALISLATGGKVPLASAYTTHKIIKEFIEYGQMYFCPSLSFATSDVDVSNNTLTLRGERFKVGDKVRFTTTTTLPAGLSLATDYWIASYNATTYLATISTSLANALNNVVVDITSQGTGTHTIAVQESADHPMSRLAGPQAAPFSRYLASEYRYYYIQGDTLFVLPATSTGQVAFAVPYYPATLADLPESNEAENIFLDVLLNILRAQGMGGEK